MSGGWRDFWRETREAAKATPGFGALVAMNVLGSFVAGLVIPVLPLYLMAHGFSIFQLGGLFSVIAVGAVLVHFLAARYPDVIGRPGVVVALNLVTALQFVGYVFVRSPLAFFAVAAVGACAGAAAGPGAQSILAAAAPIRTKARVFSLFGMLSSLGYAAAVVGGYALAVIDYRLVFLFGALAALSTTFVLLGLRLRAAPDAPRGRLLHPEERAASAALRDASGGVSRAWFALRRARFDLERTLPRDPSATRNLRLASLHIFLFGLALAVYPVYFPLYLLGHGLPMRWMGLAIAASWVAFAACQPLGARLADRIGLKTLVVGSIVAASAFNAVIALAPLPWIIGAWVLLGAADGLGRPVVSAIVGQQGAQAGRVSAYAWTQGAGATARVIAPYGLALAARDQGIAFGLLLVAGVVLLSAIPLALLFLSPARAPDASDAPDAPPAPQATGEPQ